MSELQMGASETRFAEIVWRNEPLTSMDLAELCGQQLGWKKTGTDAGNYHLEVWGAKFDFRMEDIVLDLSEVDGAKLVPMGEYIEAVCWNKDESYRAELTRFCAELRETL